MMLTTSIRLKYDLGPCTFIYFKFSSPTISRNLTPILFGFKNVDPIVNTVKILFLDSNSLQHHFSCYMGTK